MFTHKNKTYWLNLVDKEYRYSLSINTRLIKLQSKTLAGSIKEVEQIINKL